MADSDDKPPMVQLSRRIDLGHILQMATIAGAALVFVITGNDRSSTTQDELKQFRSDFSAQMISMRSDYSTQMTQLAKDVQAQNTQIPVMQNQLATMARDMVRIQDHLAAEDQVIGQLGERTGVLRSDVDDLKHASPGVASATSGFHGRN